MFYLILLKLFNIFKEFLLMYIFISNFCYYNLLTIEFLMQACRLQITAHICNTYQTHATHTKHAAHIKHTYIYTYHTSTHTTHTHHTHTSYTHTHSCNTHIHTYVWCVCCMHACVFVHVPLCMCVHTHTCSTHIHSTYIHILGLGNQNQLVMCVTLVSTNLTPL